MIDSISSWGPCFRVSFDLKIHSKVSSQLSSILAFKGNGGLIDSNKNRDRTPAIFYNKNGHLHFTNAVSLNRNHSFDKKIDLQKWYHIEIEQKWKYEKVFYIIMVNAEEIHSVVNTYPKYYDNVKVFAGNNFHPPANGSYRNLIWENLGNLKTF